MREFLPAARLERLLREELPLAGFMEVRLDAWDATGLRLRIPAGPNQNLHGTMFGGSIGAVALLAGWGLIRLRMRELGLDPELVIQRSAGEYVAPIRTGAVAWARSPEEPAWSRFLQTLRRRGRSRLHVEITVSQEGEEEPRARFDAWFVAVTAP